MGKLLDEKYRLLAEVLPGIDIKVNTNNWILCIEEGGIQWYYPYLELLLDDLYDFLLKRHVLEGVKRNLEGLKEAVEMTNKELNAIAASLRWDKKAISDRLRSKESGERGEE